MMIIERCKDEINSIGGISLIGGILNSLTAIEEFKNMNFVGVKTGHYSHSEIIRSFLGILSLGKSDFNDVELYRNDTFFRDCLKLRKVPSESIIRQRLDIMSKDHRVGKLLSRANLEVLSKVKDFGKEKTEHSEYTVVDGDVSILDNSNSKKEGVSWSYANVDGYAPMFAYIGTHGYMLECELRPGSQHTNKGTVDFIRRVIERCKCLNNNNILIRLDSGCDDSGIIEEIMKNPEIYFLIKRNLRKERKEQWLELAKAVGKCQSPREGKKVYTGAVTHIYPAGRQELNPIFTVFEVIERAITADGQMLLSPEIEVNTWWSNVPEEPEASIELYHRHGTSEQFHSELKTDLGIERLPSGSFSTNSLILTLGMIAFNSLRLIGQKSLEKKELLPVKVKVQRRRLKSVLQDLIYIGCKRVVHAGRTILKFGRNCPWVDAFRELHVTFC
jgi:hypothetical protein